MSVDVLTFGCRLNIAESEAIRQAAAGLDEAVVVNTCAVTAEAVRQARQSIRRLKRERPDARIVVTGCAAQVEPELFAAMPEVARVLGNTEKLDPRAWADDRRVAVGDIMAVKRHVGQAVDHLEGHTRAIPAGAERLRSPLHLLHHPVRARQFAVAAGGRSGSTGAPPGRARLSRDRAHRRRHHRLRGRRHAAGRAGQAHPQGNPRARAPAAVVDRFGRGR